MVYVKCCFLVQMFAWIEHSGGREFLICLNFVFGLAAAVWAVEALRA
jgi:hypothetical protein